MKIKFKRITSLLIVFLMILSSFSSVMASSMPNLSVNNTTDKTINNYINDIVNYYETTYYIDNNKILSSYNVGAMTKANADLNKWDTLDPRYSKYYKAQDHVSLILMEMGQDPDDNTYFPDQQYAVYCAQKASKITNNPNSDDLRNILVTSKYNEQYAGNSTTDIVIKTVTVTSDNIINVILKGQEKANKYAPDTQGGFRSGNDTKTSAEQTGFALQILSKYKTNANVEASINKAFQYIKDNIQPDGTIVDENSDTGFSTLSQIEIIRGLIALGQNPTSAKWTSAEPNGKNIVDGLFHFYNKSGTFGNTSDVADNVATAKVLSLLVDLKNAGYGNYIPNETIAPPVTEIKVNVAVAQKSKDTTSKILFNPQQTVVNSSLHTGGSTVLGALQSADIKYTISEDVLSSVAGIANDSTNSWKISINNKVIDNSVVTAKINENDKIIIYYTNDTVPNWQEILDSTYIAKSVNSFGKNIVDYYNKVFFADKGGQLSDIHLQALNKFKADLSGAESPEWKIDYKYTAKYDTNLNLTASKSKQIMILLECGLNPREFSSRDFISELVSKLDSETKFGINELQAVGALNNYNAKYPENKVDVNKYSPKILALQAENGSFINVPINTGYAIEALVGMTPTADITKAITKATEYIHSMLKDDGGISVKTFYTNSQAPIIRALLLAGEDVTSAKWTVPNGTNPINIVDKLFEYVNTDGSIDNDNSENPNNRSWEYATPEVLLTICALQNAGYGQYVANVKLPDEVIIPPSTPKKVTVRIESNDVTLCDKTEFTVENFNLKPYGASKELAEPSGMHALISMLELNGYDKDDADTNKYFLDMMNFDSGFISQILGVPTAGECSWMFVVNNKIADVGCTQYPLQDGDDIVFYYYNYTVGEYAYFDKDEVTVEAGTPIDLQLTGIGYDKDWNLVTAPVSGATILVSANGAFSAETPTSSLSQKDGSVQYTFENAGTYTLSAIRKDKDITDISRPYCKVTVLPNKNSEIQKTINTIASSYANTSTDWQVIDLSAIGKADTINKTEFMKKAIEAAIDDNDVKELSRTVIALSSLGISSLDFAVGNDKTINLIDKIANTQNSSGEHTLVDTAGLAFALSAYDSAKYSDTGYWTRDKIIDELYNTYDKTNGYWASWGEASVDMTAMAITSLSPYYNTNVHAKEMIDKSINWFSKAQQPDGSYQSYKSSNSNSCAMVIVALAAMGIDADKDSRFVKEGTSAVDNLLSYKLADGTFKFRPKDTKGNPMATEQAFRALISYSENKKTDNKGFNIYMFDKIADVPDENIDLELATAAKDALTLGDISNVTSDLVLSVTGLNETSISWASDKPTVISTTGKVQRPEDENQTVILTATITKGSTILTKIFTVTVIAKEGGSVPPTPSKITVTFKLIGDTKHAPGQHTSAPVWIDTISVALPKESTVGDAFKAAVDNKYSYVNKNGYISEINGLKEFDNGSGSGWMYKVNDKNPTVGLDSYVLSDGDSILWYYEDNYKSSGGIGGGSTSSANDVSISTSGDIITATTNAQCETDKSGNASANVTDSQINAAIKAGLAANKDNRQKIFMNIAVKPSAYATTITTILPKSAITAILADTAKLSISTPLGSVTIDSDTLKSIAAQLSGDIKVIISTKKVGDKNIYTVSIGDKNKTISIFDNDITVALPYELSKGENKNDVIVYSTDNSNNTQLLTKCAYNDITKTIMFITKNLAQYEVICNSKNFDDVSGWYADYVAYLSARNILNGKEENKFAPFDEISRAEFVTMLFNLSKQISNTENTNSANFKDVNENDWYFSAAQWAYDNKIAVGSNNNFNPNAKITREDMAVMLSNFIAAYKEYDVVHSKEISAFSDSSSISEYAQEAVEKMQSSGIINGKENNNFDPKANATRAEAAKILYELIRLSFNI